LRGFHRRVRVAATMAEPDTMTPGKLRLAQAAMVVRDHLRQELGVTRRTLHRFVDPRGICAPTARSC
jgi:hypothetical protein